ncbi:hypothetical protein O6H91_02G142800 [Diphasiastrum complanatum]|uniref:Uncharacterized protein n=1 Tax=Diphasiastrum complanatum TaxID=34168 RepID=A0ACC2ELK3_DIPCM|nr:hypothetical protein O6H91_02G142800 [Diphasiastrum complanatum]
MGESFSSKRSGMKCQVLQSLWACSPPRHQVTAILATQNPPFVWTGASDGAIIRWNISSEDPFIEQEVQPAALLCGHAAAIADLESCTPSRHQEVAGEQDRCSLLADSIKLINSSCCSKSPEAVISACIDGSLCVWESLTGRCQRRRRLPPWAGSPSVIASLPISARYVCIACNVDCSLPGQVSSIDTPEGAKCGEFRSDSMASKLGVKAIWKGGVLIFDTALLAVLQVVYHGVLGIGSIRSMAVTCEGILNQLEFSVSVADSFGRVRAWSHIRLESHGKQERGLPASMKDALLGMTLAKNDVTQNSACAQSVSLSSDGKLLLRVFKWSWVLNMVIDGSILAENSLGQFSNANEYTSNSKDNEDLCYFVSGCFLGGIHEAHSFQDNSENFHTASFAVCNSEGALHLYSINTLNHRSSMEVIYNNLAPADSRGKCISTKCCMLQNMLIRSESGMVAGFGASQILDTQLTVWSLDIRTVPGCKASYLDCLQSRNEEPKSYCSENEHPNGFLKTYEDLNNPSAIVKSAIFKGSGSLKSAWLNLTLNTKENGLSKSSVEENDGVNVADTVLRTENNAAQSCYVKLLGHQGSGEKNYSTLSDISKFVTATLFIPSPLQLPRLLVYGYNTGEILVVDLEGEIISKNSKCNETTEPLRQFLWHTGPILCLAEHSMRASESATEIIQVLLSGSADCCVCLWDLHQESSLLAIYRHHVGPVRQLLLPPHGTYVPWLFCFISVGDDGCVAISSLETLRVERMFPGHPGAPKSVAWDGVRGYIACLCANPLAQTVGNDILYIWDVHSGAQERVLRGTAAHSMFSYFCGRIRSDLDSSKVYSSIAPYTASFLHNLEEQSPRAAVAEGEKMQSQKLQTELASIGGTVGLGSHNVPSDSNLPVINTPHGATPVHADSTSQNVMGSLEKFSIKVVQAFSQGPKAGSSKSIEGLNVNIEKQDKLSSPTASQRTLNHVRLPIKGGCFIPGVAALQFDISLLISSKFQYVSPAVGNNDGDKQRETGSTLLNERGKSSAFLFGKAENKLYERKTKIAVSDSDDLSMSSTRAGFDKYSHQIGFPDTVEGHLLRQSLSFLHFWGVDFELDSLMEQELHICRPKHVLLGVGLAGDRGATTLVFPDDSSTFKLWRNSPEFCSMRSLTMVSLAQRLLFISPSSSACRALAAFYCRGLAEKSSGSINPSLELYACFWQDPSEHVRLAARSLFHCAAPRAVPQFLRAAKQSGDTGETNQMTSNQLTGNFSSNAPSSSDLTEWIESVDGEDWIAMIGGSYQDARAARIVVGAALAVWYPSLVHANLAQAVAPLLMKLVRAAIDKHSATAGELLAEGMATIWKELIYSEIPNLIADVFSLIECLSEKGAPSLSLAPATQEMIRESLIGNLLPSLAAAHISGFLNVVQNQLRTASSTSPVHLVALMAVVRMMRDATKAVLPFIFQVSSFILQTMDPANSLLRKHCLHTAMTAVREMVRLFPMVALHQGFVVSNAKLAVADAIGDLRSLAIHVYDLYSVTKLKVLDASGPPGYLTLISRNRNASVIGGISALSFSPDGEGLTMRWWSLGAAWWEKLSRALVPVQCTKMILVPPSAGFSPKSSHASIISTLENNNHAVQENDKEGTTAPEHLLERPFSENMDLSYRLEWRYGRTVALLHHGEELFSVQL